MLLDDKGIEEFIADMKKNNLNLNLLKIRFNPKDTFVLISGNGAPGISQEDEYYINFEENLIATEFSWLESFCKATRTKIEAKVPVLPDGNFKHSEISIKANIEVPTTVNNLFGFLHSRYKSFALLYPYVKKFTMNGYQGKIRNIFINLELDAKVVNKTLNEKALNYSILEQWLYMTEKCQRDNSYKDHMSDTFKVINGKINYQAKTEVVSKYFKFKSEELVK